MGATSKRGDDVYIIRYEDGHDTLYESGGNDLIRFIDASPEDIVLSTDGNHIYFDFSFGGSLTVKKQLSEYYWYYIESFEFANGVEWDREDLLSNLRTHQLESGVVTGSSEDDTYSYSLGGKGYSIYDHSYYSSSNDTLIFEDLLSGDIEIRRYGDDAVLITPNDEKIRIVNAFLIDDYYQIENLVFSDGQVWDFQAFLVEMQNLRKSSGLVFSSPLGNIHEHYSSDGSYTLLDYSRYSGISSTYDDRLIFKDLVKSQIAISSVGDHFIYKTDNGHELKIYNAFDSDDYGFEYLEFSDGETLSGKEILQKYYSDSKASNGVIVGTKYKDSINIFRSDGRVKIIDKAYIDFIDSRYNDSINFFDISSSEVNLYRKGFSLFIDAGNDSLVEVDNHYKGTDFRIEEINFSDGVSWDLEDINRLSSNKIANSEIYVGLGHYTGNTYNYSTDLDKIVIIEESSPYHSIATDKIIFSDISSINISYIRRKSDLIIRSDDYDIISILNFFTDSNHRIEEFHFSDGVVVSDNYVLSNYIIDDESVYIGTSDVDEYHHTYGTGSIVIEDYDYDRYANRQDALYLHGVDPSDVALLRSSDSLVILLSGEEHIVFADYFSSDHYKIESIKFDNNDVWTKGDIFNTYVNTAQELGYVAGSHVGETYIIDSDFTSLEIEDYDYDQSENDHLIFSDSLLSDFKFSRVEDDLILTSATSEVTIHRYFYSNSYRVEGIEFADGLVIDESEIWVKYVTDSLEMGLIRGTEDSEDYIISDLRNDVVIKDYNNRYNYKKHMDKVVFSDSFEDDFTLIRIEDDLAFMEADGGKIIIDNFFYSSRYAIELVEFSDGVLWTYTDIIERYINDASDTGYVKGTRENDIYTFTSGQGNLDILDYYKFNESRNDQLVFTDLGLSQVTFIKEGENLLISTNTNEQVRIQNYFLGNNYWVEEIEFSSGESLNNDEISKLVNIERTSSDVSDTSTDGDNYIEGSSGDDILEGGLGRDTLIGNGGNDTYVFTKGDGHDIIRDSEGWNDTIELSGYILSDLKITKVSRNTNDLLLSFYDNNDSIKIVNGASSNFFSSYWNQIEFLKFVDTDESVRLSEILGDVVLTSPSEFNDEIRGNRFGNTLTGGLGSDRLIGGEGDDIYLYHKGDGDDTVIDSGRHDTADTIQFVDYLSSDITYIAASGEEGRDAIIRFSEGSDRVTLYNAFDRDDSSWSVRNLGIEKLVFSDGVEWDRSKLTEKVIQYSATDDNDSIYGYFGADILQGGTGDDLLDGREGGDSYIISRYEGSDSINDSGTNAGDIDKLKFIDIISSEVQASRLFKGSETVIFSYIGSEETITVTNAISATEEGIEYYEFNDGVIWSKENIKSLLNNNTPVAQDDGFFTVTTETPLIIQAEELLKNDYDPDGEDLSIVSVQSDGNGVAEINADGDVVFYSIGFFSGATQFQYTVSDEQNGFSTASVNVRVRPFAQANDDMGISVSEDSEVAIDALQLLSNDADGDRMVIGEVFNAVNGSVTLSSSGQMLFTPDTDFVGKAYFDYAANTPEGGRAEATVTIDVLPVNDAPVAFRDYLASVNEGDVFLVNIAELLSNDRDIDGDDISLIDVTSSDNANVSLIDDNTIEVRLSPDFFGYGDFQYSIEDNSGVSASASVKFSVKPVNDAPVTQADDISTLEDSPILILVDALLLNDSDADGDSLSISSVFGAKNGTVSLRDNGTILFTPEENFSGTAQFQYKADDGQGGTSFGYVNVAVEAIEDNPEAQDDTYIDYALLTSSENQFIEVSVSTLLANDFDVDGDTFEFVDIFAAENGVVEWVDAETIRFTPNPGYFGEASFYYNVKDNTGAVDDAQVLMMFTNTGDVAPFAVKDSVDVYEDTPTFIAFNDLLANDYDVDGDQLQIIDWFVLHSNVAPEGVVSMLAEGFLFTPDANVTETFGFYYVVSDGTGNTSNAYIDLNIIPVNDEPVVVGDDLGEYHLEAPVVIRITDLLSNDEDVDGDTLAFVSAEDPETGYFERYDEDFLIFYPTTSANSVVQFKYHVADPSGLQDEGYSEFALVSGQYDGQLNGAIERDLLIGSEQSDVIGGLAGRDDIYGEAGDDTINGGDGSDYIDGGSGFDTVTLVGSNVGVRVDLNLGLGQGGWAQGDRYYNIESVEGSDYSDQIYGDFAGNTLRGNAGHDLLSGEQGNDWLYGDKGDDILRGGLGSDFLDGGDGKDTADYSDAELALNLDLSLDSHINGGAAEGDRLSNIEGIIGTDFDDVIRGNTESNHLSGGRGNDLLSGGEGDDTLNGGRGADVLVGGLGIDTADYSISSERIVIDLNNDTQTGGDAEGDSLVGIEVIQGSYHDDIIIGDDADNIFRGGQGADKLHGGIGFDTADYSESNEGVHVNLLSGQGLHGDAQGDVLAGIESIVGSAFNDVLEGSEGEDTFEGGFGDDVLSGGLGSDNYHFTQFIGLDRIEEGEDFDAVDEVRFDTSILPKDISLIQQGNDLIIEVEKSTDVVLHVITVADHFLSTSTGIEVISFASGMSWDRDGIQSMLRDGSFSANDDTYLLANEDETTTFTLDWLTDNDQFAEGEVVTLVNAVAVSGGDVAIIGGAIEFTGTENYHGDAYFSYTIQDQFGRESSAKVELNLAPVNDAPNANDDGVFVGVEDNVLVIPFADLLGNDTDIDGDQLTISDAYFSGISQSMLGGGVFIRDGDVHIKPPIDHYGYAEFTYEVSDNLGGVDTAKVELFYESVNDAPKSGGNNLSYRGARLDKTNVYIASDLLNSVHDPEGDDYYFDGLTGAAENGIVELIDTGLPVEIDGVVYEEPIVTFVANSLGDATFQYLVTDEHGATNTITVNVDVKPLNSKPIAKVDEFEIVEDEVLLIDASMLLENDIDHDDDVLLISDVNEFANNGKVEILDSGTIQFTPKADFNGEAGFSYTVSDGRGGLSQAYVNVVVKPQNDAPVLVNDLVIRQEDEQSPITILAGEIFGNDSDRQGDVIFLNDVVLLGEAVDLVRDGTSGTFHLQRLDDAIAYSVDVKLASGALLPEWIDYDEEAGAFSIYSELADGNEPKTVHLNIELKTSGIEPAFEARDNTYTIELEISPQSDEALINTLVTEHLGLLEGLVSSMPPSIDGVLLSSFIKPMEGITATLSGGDSLPEWLSFDPMTLTFDGVPPEHLVGSIPVRLSIPSSNTQPTYRLFAEVVIDDVGFKAVPDVTADWNGESISVDVPEHYHGNLVLAYKAEDEKGAVSVQGALIVLNIQPERDLPIAETDFLRAKENTPLEISVMSLLENDKDLDGDSIQITDIKLPLTNRISIVPTVPPLVTTDKGVIVERSFSAKLSDGGELPDWMSLNEVTGEIIGYPPSDLETSVYSITWRMTDGAEVSEYEEDIEISGETNTSGDDLNGQLDITLGTLSFSPSVSIASGSAVTASFESGEVLPEWLSVNTETGVLSGLIPLGYYFQDTIVWVIDNGETIESHTEVVTINGNEGAVVTFTPPLDTTGHFNVNYTLTDAVDGEVIGVAVVDVLPQQVAPLAFNDEFKGQEDQPILISVSDLLANDEDYDDDLFVLTEFTQPDHGTVSLSDGVLTYTPNVNHYGDDSFTYTITDNLHGEATAIVYIDLEEVNLAPEANRDSFVGVEDEPLVIDIASLLVNDTDPNAEDTLDVVAVYQDDNNGQGFVLSEQGKIQLVPNHDVTGVIEFRYTLSDGRQTDFGYIDVEFVAKNDAPHVEDDYFVISRDTTLQITTADLIDNDFDVEGDTITLVNAFDGDNGNVSVDNGIITFTPNAHYFGNAGFTYQVTDGQEVTTGYVSVDVLPSETTITLKAPLSDRYAVEEKAFNIQLQRDLFVSTQGAVLTFDLSRVDGEPLPDWLLFNDQDLSLSGTPPTDFVGEFLLRLHASDGVTTVADDFVFSVVSVNDAPTLVSPLNDIFENSDGSAISAGEAFSFNVEIDKFSDIDGDSLAYTVQLASGAPLPSWMEFDGQTLSGYSPANVRESVALELFATDGIEIISDQFIVNFVPQNAIWGADSDDIISGTGEPDIIYGLGGNDTLYGQLGDDYLDGGAGDDLIYGISGSNVLLGGAGNDVLDSGVNSFDNYLDGQAGEDRITGGTGTDIIAFDREDFSGSTTTLSSGKVINENVYNAGSGFDVLSIKGSWHADFTGVSYQPEAGVTGNVISGIEAIVGDEYDQNVTINAFAINAQSDDTIGGDWQGFVAILGGGEDTFNLEGAGWNYVADAMPAAEFTADMAETLGITLEQVELLGAYSFRHLNSDTYITVWTDAERISFVGSDIEPLSSVGGLSSSVSPESSTESNLSDDSLSDKYLDEPTQTDYSMLESFEFSDEVLKPMTTEDADSTAYQSVESSTESNVEAISTDPQHTEESQDGALLGLTEEDFLSETQLASLDNDTFTFS
ncbi:tandem-95 repeat protein [Grimontia marina]|uniref:Bifunctional hemolysin/adenylate cyclase n=1 Tax=Grimontia marina TaxID=646534 RepID=A0A128F5C5_9GAMM|nr:tandem-95 repeat protein [Grimontia marina]CZF81506.1 Bifunctional hemolysin/adenylate cyclase precursor [Grimontia marina]